MPINIQIQGIEDLIFFVSIIKGEPIDLEKLRKLTVELNASSKNLEQAVQQQGVDNAAKGIG